MTNETDQSQPLLETSITEEFYQSNLGSTYALVPLVMVISISYTEELYFSMNGTINGRYLTIVTMVPNKR